MPPGYGRARGDGGATPAASALGYYTCPLCAKAFSSRQRCLHHEAQHRSTGAGGDVTLRCLECGATFGELARLVAHAHAHRAAPPSRFPCRVCGKEFDKQGYLGQHMKMHAQPQYKCPTCERRFFWRAGRNRHAKMCAAAEANQAATSGSPARPN